MFGSYMVLLLFFCSGATALVYEVLWSKYLSLMIGTTVHAQTLVLGVFMGGLALGNSLFGRSSKALKQPLLAYGYMELGIALYAAVFDWLFHLADGFFVTIGSALLGHTSVLLLIKGVLSVCLLLIPTVLMGGTLPMLAAWLQQNRADSGRLTARFYSVNTLGAVCGAALAGFYLIKTFGLVPTALIAGLVNAAVGTIAIGLSRRQLAAPPRPAESKGSVEAPPVGLLFWSGVLVAVTGAVSMGLEILASRALAMTFGSSVQAFALVLIAFILGIGFGSAAIASPRLRPRNTHRFITLLLLAAAVWVALLVFRIESWVDFYARTNVGLARNGAGYVYHQFLTAAMALGVLGVPAALIGAVLPLLMRVVSESAAFLGAEIGRLLTWNTLGAVVGVLLTGFVLMPALGLRNAFVALASVLALAAVVQAGASAQRFITAFAGIIAAGVLAVFFTGGERWKLAFSTGIFRYREDSYDPDLMRKRSEAVRLLFYEDAPDATISVEQSRNRGYLYLRVNGKTDASSHGDYSTQVLMAHLPLMVRPNAKEVFLLGLGSGITAGAVLAHPVERLIVAENCRPIITGANFFHEYNNGILTNSTATIVKEDGRAYLKLSPQKYDVIISEPSNPWTVGSSGIFSTEFYEIAAARLKDDGIMAQWFHVYEMDDTSVAMVLRTFGTVFPHFEIWDAAAGDLILLGRKAPWQLRAEDMETVFQRPIARDQLDRCGLRTVPQILARQLASQRTAFAIAGDGTIQSDYLPILEYVAPRSFFIGQRATSLKTFDERTIQWPLMPPDKYAILAALDDATVTAAFTNRASVNPELVPLLNWRVAGYYEPWPTVGTVPSVFRGTNAPLPRPGEHIKEPVLGEIEDAVEWLRHRPTDRERLVKQVQDFLQKGGKSLLATNAESAAYFARVATRQALGYGDYAGARQLLEIGLAADPADTQLRYLTRILEREQADARPMARTR